MGKPRNLQDIEKEQKESIAKSLQKHILYMDGNGNIQFVKAEENVETKNVIKSEKVDAKVHVEITTSNIDKTKTKAETTDSSKITENSNIESSTVKSTITSKKDESIGNSQIGKTTDLLLLRQFLSGEHCLTGGTGWWRHEFCYGKHIHQYHKDKKEKIVIVLGNWEKSSHISWLENNPSKKPKQTIESRKSVNHFYGNGDKCDLTGLNRWSEVRLKCVENPSKPHSIAIFLIEPNPCEYTIVVESALFCKLIKDCDENGLLSIPEILNF